MKFFFILLVVTLSLVENVKADLPVHCLARDVAGKWTLFLDSNLQSTEPKCGHSRPDRNTDHVEEIEKAKNSDIPTQYELQLPNIVLDSKGNEVGKWTMVYDEGFSLDVMGYSFFAFSKYTISQSSSARDTDDEQTNGYFSDCSKTFNGWYTFQGKFGCFFGQKSVTTKNDIPHENAAIFHGVQGEKILQRDISSSPQTVPVANSNSGDNSQPLTNHSLFANGPLNSLSSISNSGSNLQNGPIDFGGDKKQEDNLSLFDKFQNNMPL